MNKQILIVMGLAGMVADQRARLVEKLKETYPSEEYELIDENQSRELLEKDVTGAEALFTLKSITPFSDFMYKVDEPLLRNGKTIRDQKQQNKYRAKYHSR